MQEVLFRQRNLRHLEMATVIELVSNLGHIMLDAVYGPAQDDEAYKRRHAPLYKATDRMLKEYEAEVFEERYLPSYRQAEAEEERRQRLEALERERRETLARQRVAKFSEEESPEA